MPPVRTAATLLATLSLGGCVDRVLRPTHCGDGVATPGEACFEDGTEFLAMNFTPIALRVAPFDADERPDVLVTGTTPELGVVGAVSVTGEDGALGVPRDAGVYGCSAHPALGDANGDDVTDLLVNLCDDTMLVFVADGAGAFAPPAFVDLDLLTRTSSILDVDRDGLADVIALGVAGDAIVLSWAPGDGRGGYGPPHATWVGTLGAPDEPLGFSVGAIDDDALPDVLLSHADPTQPPRLARGTGGPFAPPVALDELPACRGVAFRDIDGDGDDEMLVVRADPATFEVWRGREGSLWRERETEIDIAEERPLAAGDVDGDGALDFAFFDPAATDVEIWLGDGEGGWAYTADVEVGAAIDQLAVADLDGDGAAELVAGTFARGGVTVVRGDP